MPSNNYIYKMSNAGGMSTITRYTDMLAGNAAFVDTAYESIATVTVGSGGAANIEFTSISASYSHLQIRWIARNTSTAQDRDTNNLIFNSDTGANYSRHFLYGTGSSANSSDAAASATSILTGLSDTPTAIAGSSIFGVGIIDVLDYANTNKYKTVRVLSGQDQNNTSGRIFFSSGSWQSTSAITTIKLTPNVGNFVQYSSFALYGIKG
jgi:hypothetical protein